MTTVPTISSESHALTYLDTLNPDQRQAVETLHGAVLVLAGAGTGKTRVLTTRISHILATQQAYPSQILAATFTNKAAHQMRERVQSLLNRSVEGMWLGTFHALGARMLRQHAEKVGLTSDFTIIDPDDQRRLIKQILQAHGVDDRKYTPRIIVSIINRWKDRALTPEKLTKSDIGTHTVAYRLYTDYQERLKLLNAADFGDLLLHCITLFHEVPEVLAHYQEKFQYILVDEYQDTNIAQYLWLRFLALKGSHICCVGDEDQSIYAWRGAEIGNILRFEQDFPGATIIRLEQNYRSTHHILGAASGLISQNHNRLGKILWTEEATGEKVSIRGTWDSNEEARYIAEEIEVLQRARCALSDMAILVRAGFQTREFEDCLLALGIPYRVLGGLRFYERQEIRDALAYLRLVNQPDDGLAFERIINTPKRGIGNASLQLIHQYAREQHISLPRAALELAQNKKIRGGACTAIMTFFDQLERWRQQAQTMDHIALTKIILEESGYTKMWQQDQSADAPGRLENLKELINALKNFENLSIFLEHVSLVMEAAHQSHEGITIMTFHAAKGLEFDVVFLAGWEEGLFPHARALEESGQDGLEEERRLAYVGLTRARKKAIITYALNRRSYQGWQNTTPTRFIKELPTEHIEHHAVGHFSTPQRSVEATRSFSRKALGSRWLNRTTAADREPMQQSFDVGQRIFHQKFGYGSVLLIDGPHLKIQFEHSGEKTILAHFVNPA